MATFQLSPAVDVREIDLTNIIPAVSASVAAFSGAFQWGPVDEVRLISNEKELLEVYGKPNTDTYAYWFSAALFFGYSNAMRINRRINTSAYNANSGGASGLLIKNSDHYDAFTLSSPNTYGAFAARYPGALGNSLKVAWCFADDSSPYAYNSWTYASNFIGRPNTSNYVEKYGGSNDEVHMVVIDEDGLWTGEKGTILERFQFLSLAVDAKQDDGTDNYYKNVINLRSNYIWVIDDHADFTGANAGSTAADTTFFDNSASPALNTTGTASLTTGADGNELTLAQHYGGYDVFKNTETHDVSLIVGGPTPNSTPGDEITFANYITVSVAEWRKDAVGFISPPVSYTVGIADPVSTITAFADNLTSTSYGVLDSCAVKVYDKYNDVYRWCPGNGVVAGLCAHTDNITDPWFSPAGFNRGQIRNVTKLAFNPDKTDRDELYTNRTNPLVQFPGEGMVLFGDKTLLAKPSAFDRINVRRLFIVLEKAVSTAAKYQLFEFNDEFTRAQFKNMVEPYLREVKGRRGIFEFFVVCDETNNTPEVIDRNEFVADIYIKPARSINFITLNFIATRTGADFQEIIGQRTRQAA